MYDNYKSKTEQQLKQLACNKTKTKVVEANKIVSYIGWKYEFQEFYIRKAYDRGGRSLSMYGTDFDSLNRTESF